ncbi:MAG: RtcB family protein [Anaerolineales bacterium]|nr:RtcB family protein [Anaerolineales bacterium]
MRVPAHLYASQEMLDSLMADKTIDQLINMATLPGAVKWAVAMPDAHQGYGFCIGGVLATELPDGVISPGGVGYDINCGVRLLVSEMDKQEALPHIAALMDGIKQNCPSGLGKGGVIKLSSRDLDDILVNGSKWSLKKGYATPEDLSNTESGGSIPGGQVDKISQRARQRGTPQTGTLGSGNHFIEIDYVEEIFDPQVADEMGLFPGQIAVQIHSGSRGLGHQVASDYVHSFQSAVHKYGIKLADRELVCAPLNSPEGEAYFGAMCAAANYAFNNRQLLTHWVRTSFVQVLAPHTKRFNLRQIYDIAHNIAKIETHIIDGKPKKLCVHRKGATRSFGPGFKELPESYQKIGQPVLVPGSMGTASWVLVGTEKSASSFGSCCHGAGRTMSRSRAKKEIWGSDLKDHLEEEGIQVRAGSLAGLAEEAPAAYKDVDMVVEIVHAAGLATKVARLKPMGVLKG